MDGCSLKVFCLERLLQFRFTPDINSNSYVRSMVKGCVKMIGSFYYSSKYLTPVLFPIFTKKKRRSDKKSTITNTSELKLLSSHLFVWWLSTLPTIPSGTLHVKKLPCTTTPCEEVGKYRVDKELYLTLPHVSHKRNVTSLSVLYPYFYGKCFDELHSLVPPAVDFVAGNHRDTCKRMNHRHFLRIPLKWNVHCLSGHFWTPSFQGQLLWIDCLIFLR